ncbi:RNA-binding protein PNO1 [Holothuria leucospilota]|uniref:RNA-binding protein PNO1 n=1 Tax=Holothuria leucospilota TaxID=206669 RepID=A0A9Q1HHD2_HOLLE|nr:RNA-binding protein PNO1 [Holothuria leucospilota]
MAAPKEGNVSCASGEKMEESNRLADADGFIKVQSKRGRKRKAEGDQMEVDNQKKRPQFPPLQGEKLLESSKEVRKIAVPANRYTPLKENWMKIFTPVVEHLKLQIRFNIKTRTVELRASKETKDINALQKGQDFVRAFVLGFDVEDALALLRLDELFIESFEVADVKSLKGDHLSRAIGRIAGSGGKTKFTIENVTKTRIILANSKIHILGSFQNIKIARTAICNLILGSPPSKVYGNMRAVASRSAERF